MNHQGGFQRASGRWSRWQVALCAVVVGQRLIGISPALGQHSAVEADRAAERSLVAVLAEPSRLMPGERTIKTLAQEIAKVHGVRVVLLETDLKDSGRDENELVEVSTTNLSLEAALQMALGPSDLTAVVVDDTLILTTTVAAEELQAVRVHPVGDLVNGSWAVAGLAGAGRPVRYPDFDSLIEVLVTIVSPQSWDENGGPSQVLEFIGDSPASDVLVLGQTTENDQQIADLLEQIRAVGRNPARANGNPIAAASVLRRSPAAQAIEKALATRGDWAWQDITLHELNDQLASRFGIDAVVDAYEFKDSSIDSMELRLSDAFTDCTLETALRTMLAEHEANLYVRRDALHVTSRLAAEEAMEIRVFPVGDLVDAGRQEFSGRLDGWLSVDELFDVCISTIEPDSWDEAGGPGAIQEFLGDGARQHLVCVANTRDVLRQIGLLLDDLRRVRGAWNERGAHGPFALLATSDDATATRLEKALATQRSWNLQGEFSTAAREISKVVSVPIVIENRLRDKEIDYADQAPLAAVLDRLSQIANCEWEMRDGQIVFHDQMNAGGHLQLLAWNVADLHSFRHPLEDYLNQVLADAGAPADRFVSVLIDEQRHAQLLVTWLPAAWTSVVQQALDRARGRPAAPRPVEISRPGENLSEYSRRTYRLKGLAGQPVAKGARSYGRPGTTAELAELLETMVEPETWNAAGGRGQIEIERESLSIRQSGAMHAQVEAFFKALQVLE